MTNQITLNETVSYDDFFSQPEEIAEKRSENHEAILAMAEEMGLSEGMLKTYLDQQPYVGAAVQNVLLTNLTNDPEHYVTQIKAVAESVGGIPVSHLDLTYDVYTKGAKDRSFLMIGDQKIYPTGSNSLRKAINHKPFQGIKITSSSLPFGDLNGIEYTLPELLVAINDQITKTDIRFSEFPRVLDKGAEELFIFDFMQTIENLPKFAEFMNEFIPEERPMFKYINEAGELIRFSLDRENKPFTLGHGGVKSALDIDVNELNRNRQLLPDRTLTYILAIGGFLPMIYGDDSVMKFGEDGNPEIFRYYQEINGILEQMGLEPIAVEYIKPREKETFLEIDLSNLEA